MKSLIFVVLISLLSYTAFFEDLNIIEASEAKTIKIAVIDTGLDIKDPRFSKHICKKGHKSFSNDSLDDKLGHGTHVAGIIIRELGEGDYCLLVYKFYDLDAPGSQNQFNVIKSIQLAAQNGASYVNISAGGEQFDIREYEVIKNMPNVTIITSTLNNGKDLDIPGNEVYPAMYNLPNIVAVGSINEHGQRSIFSNYTTKMVVEVGENVFSYLPHGTDGFLSGTSMAAPKRTARLVRQALNKKPWPL